MPSNWLLQRTLCWLLVASIFVMLVNSDMIGHAVAETFDEKYGGMISDDVAAEAIQVALKKLRHDMCDGDPACSPATAEEFENPPISSQDSRAAMVFAIKSALAKWCGLDSNRSFLPMIAYGKKVKKFNDRQLFLMSLIHGDFLARQYAFYKNVGTNCPSSLKEQLDAQLPKLN